MDGIAAPPAPVAVPGAAPAAAPLAFSTEVNLAQPLSWFGSGSGSEYTPKQFIHEIDQRRIRCGWTDAQTLSFVGVCLKGAALNWFRSTPRLAESAADRDAFAGRGPDAWVNFQALFLRSHLAGGKTHRIDQRRTFLQEQNEPVVGFRSRGLEAYSTFRDEQFVNLAKATTINVNLDHFLENAIVSARLDREHFGHAAPEGDIDECDDAPQDVVTRTVIAGEIRQNLRPRIVELLRHVATEMTREVNAYLIREFSKYLLVDGLYHNDTRKYAMDLIQKGQDDIVLFWDFVHKYNESHHSTNHAHKNNKPQSKDGGYCPSAGAANGLTEAGNADGLQKGSLPHTPGAVCDFCGKKNHTAQQCMKKKNQEKNKTQAPAKRRRQKGKAAGLSTDEEAQQQQQQQQQVPQVPQQPPLQYYPVPPPSHAQHAAALHHPVLQPPPMHVQAPPHGVQHPHPPAQGHPGLGQGQAGSIAYHNVAPPPTDADLPATLNGNAWC